MKTKFIGKWIKGFGKFNRISTILMNKSKKAKTKEKCKYSYYYIKKAEFDYIEVTNKVNYASLSENAGKNLISVFLSIIILSGR